MMQAIQCQNCDSVEVVRRGDEYVCLACGTRYEAGIAHLSRVSIDRSEEIQNLFRAARRAKDLGNYDGAQGYYDQVLGKNPDSWEAVFNTVYLRILQSRVGQIDSSAQQMRDTLPMILALVRDEYTADEQDSAVAMISQDLLNLNSLLGGAASNLQDQRSTDAALKMLRGGAVNIAVGAINQADASLRYKATRRLCAEMLLAFGAAAYAAFGEEIAHRPNATVALERALTEAIGIYSSLGDAASEARCVDVAKLCNPEFKTEHERALAYFQIQSPTPSEEPPKKKRKWFGR